MEGYPRYKFYLDNQLLATEPRGWDNIRYFIQFDRNLNGLLFRIDANLHFSGDGGTILSDALYAEGFCGQKDLKLLEKCSSVGYQKQYEGIIKLSKIEINERAPCEVSIKPDDNSYFAKIQNARKQKALLYVGRSKNDVDITPATISKGSFFEPATGTYYPILAGTGQEYSCSVITVYEAFKFLIAFMTDGDVEFDSTLFGPGGDDEGLVITSGRVLFTVQTGLSEQAFKDEFPEISFDEIFKEVYKKRNIGFYMDYSGAKPKMFIERDRDIPNGVDIVTLDKIDEIKTTVNRDRLYNIIRLGSQDTLDVISLAFPESIDILGFKEEQYNTIGDCTEDNTLDLVSEWIVSSNVIEDAVVGPQDAYEGRVFLIETTLTLGIYVANQANDLLPPPPPYYYNQGLTNAVVLDEFFGAIPISIAKYLGTGDDTFLAKRDPFTSGLISTSLVRGASNEPIQFNDDFTPPQHDVNNHWGNGTPQGTQVTRANSRFTAFASGIYTFRITAEEINATAGASLTWALMRYDASNVFLNFANVSRTYPVTDVYVNEVFEITLFMNATDYIQVDLGQPFLIFVDDFFHSIYLELIAAPGIAITKTFDPKDYLGLVHEFDYPIKRSQLDLIRSNPRGNIVFAQEGQNFRRARILSIEGDPDGDSKVRLITTIRANQ